MSERSVLAYFRTREEAEEALAKLQALRVIESRIDRIRLGPGEQEGVWSNPATGQAAGLGEGVLDVRETNPDAGVLTAAYPSASGQHDGGQDGHLGRDILLTAIVDESVHDKAVRLIEQTGGML